MLNLNNKQITIKATDISFWYNKNDIFIRNVNFELFENQIVGVIGENGTGKTTLIKILLGIIKPKKGQIDNFNNTISYVPQNSLSFVQSISCSVLELILSSQKGIKSDNKIDNKIDNISKLLGLEKKLNSNIKDLSGGERQRVLIARSLYRDPKIMVFDEPTSNLDKKYRQIFYEIIEEYKKNKTIIVISHDNSKISQISNEIICLHDHHTFEQNKNIIHFHHD